MCGMIAVNRIQLTINVLKSVRFSDKSPVCRDDSCVYKNVNIWYKFLNHDLKYAWNPARRLPLR